MENRRLTGRQTRLLGDPFPLAECRRAISSAPSWGNDSSYIAWKCQYGVEFYRRPITHLLASPYSSAGALINCLPSLHRLHLNVSCVSQTVFSLNLKSCRRSSPEKCRSVSSAASTTQADKSCLEHLKSPRWLSSFSSESQRRLTVSGRSSPR
jgi:hypothetical protein